MRRAGPAVGVDFQVAGPDNELDLPVELFQNGNRPPDREALQLRVAGIVKTRAAGNACHHFGGANASAEPVSDRTHYRSSNSI